MDSDQFFPDAVERLLDLMKETLGDGYSYFDDEVDEIPESYLPCVMVWQPTMGVRAGPTTADEIGDTVVIAVVLPLKDDLGANGTQNLTGTRLRRLIAGMDPATEEWKQGTVMRALRTHFTLDDLALENDLDVDFTPNNRGNNVYTKEAYITIRINRYAKVVDRGQ